MIPPEFTERLRTKEVKEGSTVTFSVRVTGKPPPEVTWYREGSQIVSSPDFEIKQDGHRKAYLVAGRHLVDPKGINSHSMVVKGVSIQLLNLIAY